MTKQGRLQDRVVLARLSIRKLGRTVRVKDVEQEAAQNHAASEDRIKAHIAKLSKADVEAITKIESEARGYFYAHTLPWTHQGQALLATAAFVPFEQKMNAFKAQFSKAVADLASDWPGIVQRARVELGDLFKPEMFPSAFELQNAYTFSVGIEPLPNADDLRLDVSDAERNRIAAEIRAQQEAAIKSAVQTLYKRLADAIKAMADKLAAFDPNKKGTERGTFRDSLIENVLELVDLAKTSNVTDDPTLAGFVAEAEKSLITLSADTLRKDDKARAEVATKAAEIAGKMQAFAGWFDGDQEDAA